MKHVVFVTGAAGYVGSMLVQQLAKREDIGRIIGLDKEPISDLIKDEPKLLYIQANTSDGTWQEKVRPYAPDIVIHTAWQIRMIYGEPETTWKWNVDGSRAVFEFAFSMPSVRRLVHYSTVSLYGAFSTNTFKHRFTENKPAREKEYLYAVEKAASEDVLRKFVQQSGAAGPQVAVVRPAAITGPRGRFMRVRFGLQAALSGQLKGGVYDVLSLLVAWVPATRGWVRQFIHEDDVCDLTIMLSFEPWKGERYEVFNITPPGEPVYAKDMARAVGKRTLLIMPWMARLAYFFFWHVSNKKVPTAPGSWRFYSYPLVVDGTKLTRIWGYQYRTNSLDAFYYTNGRYESYVPETFRRHKVDKP